MITVEDSANKTVAYMGVPWEDAYGYAQVVRAGNTLYVSGQLSHDDQGKLVGPAPVDASGKITDTANMELQMRTAYANAAKLLAKFGATFDDVVEETLYVTDVDAAVAVAGSVRKAAYGSDRPQCASTLVGTTRLAFPEQLIEVSFTVVLQENKR